MEQEPMTYLDIAREYFPDASDPIFDILWNYTGFPDFWRILEDGATPEECLRRQLRDLVDRTKDRIVL